MDATHDLTARSRGLKLKLFSWFKSAGHSRRSHFDMRPSSSSDITLLRNSRLTSSIRTSSSSRPLSTDATFLSSEGMTHLPLVELRRSVSSERYLSPQHHEGTHSDRSYNFNRKEEIRRSYPKSSELIAVDRRYLVLENNDFTANKENVIPFPERKSILKSSVSSVTVSERPSSSSSGENRPSSRKSKGHITFEDERQLLPRTSTVAMIGNTMLPPSLSQSIIERTTCKTRHGDQSRFPLKTIEGHKEMSSGVVDSHRPPKSAIEIVSRNRNGCSSNFGQPPIQLQKHASRRSYQNLQDYSKEFIDRTTIRCDCSAQPLVNSVIKTFCSKCQVRTKDRTSHAVRTRILTDRRKRKNILHYIEPDMSSSRLLLNRLVRLKNEEEQNGISADDEQSVACSCVHCFSSDFQKNRNVHQIRTDFERVPQIRGQYPDNLGTCHDSAYVCKNLRSATSTSKRWSNNLAQIPGKSTDTMYKDDYNRTKKSTHAIDNNKTKAFQIQVAGLPSNKLTLKNDFNSATNYYGYNPSTAFKSQSADGLQSLSQAKDKNPYNDDVKKHHSITESSCTKSKSRSVDAIAKQENCSSLRKVQKNLSKTEKNTRESTMPSYFEKSKNTTSLTKAELPNSPSAWYENIEDDISKGLLRQTEDRGSGAESHSVSSLGFESSATNSTLGRLVENAVKQSIEHILAANSLPILSSPQRSQSLEDLRPRIGSHKKRLLFENVKSFLRANAVSVVSAEYTKNKTNKTAEDEVNVTEPLYANVWDFCSGKWGSVPDLTSSKGAENIREGLKKHRSLDCISTPRSTASKGIDVEFDVSYKVGEIFEKQSYKESIKTAHLMEEVLPDNFRQKLDESDRNVNEENRLSPDGWESTQSQVNNSTICSESLELIEELTRLGKGLPSKIGAARKSPVKKIKYKAKDVLSGKAKLKLTIYKNGSLLTVHIIRAAALFSTRCHNVNCYVKVSLHPDELKRTNWRTNIVKADNNPSFNQKFSFEILPEDKDKRLMISVWHRDIINRRSEFLGCMTFGIQHIVDETQSIRGWYRLLQENVGTRKHFAARRWIRPDFLPNASKPYGVKSAEEITEARKMGN